MRIRPGNVDDRSAVLNLFDEAVAWLVERGRGDRLPRSGAVVGRRVGGTAPWSGDPRREERVHDMIEDGDLYLAEVDARPPAR